MDGEVWADVWQWWLEHGLDGIAGGVLGGAVGGLIAWYAVRVTIRHERELHAQDRARGDTQLLEGEVAALNGVAFATAFGLGESEEASRKANFMALHRHIIRVEALAIQHSRSLATDLATFRELLPDAFENPDLREGMSALAWLCQGLNAHLFGWMALPDALRDRIPHPDWPLFVAEIRERARATPGWNFDEPPRERWMQRLMRRLHRAWDLRHTTTQPGTPAASRLGTPATRPPPITPPGTRS